MEENSLYGRNKLSNDIGEELREIQGRLRKSSNKSYGMNGFL